MTIEAASAKAITKVAQATTLPALGVARGRAKRGNEGVNERYSDEHLIHSIYVCLDV